MAKPVSKPSQLGSSKVFGKYGILENIFYRLAFGLKSVLTNFEGSLRKQCVKNVSTLHHFIHFSQRTLLQTFSPKTLCQT